MSNRTTVFRGLQVLALGLGALVVVGTAQAETRWEARHPRRDQVLDRTHRLHHRIVQERREGELSPTQARNLQRQDRRVRQREQTMAQRNGGYITPQQQASLNQQENRISQHVGQ